MRVKYNARAVTAALIQQQKDMKRGKPAKPIAEGLFTMTEHGREIPRETTNNERINQDAQHKS